MSPGASRTLSNLEQMESPGSIPAVPAATGAAAGTAPAAGLSAQRAEAVEALKLAAVQRRLPVVPVPLGPAGTPLSIPLSSWLLCESLIRWAGAWQPGEIVTAADALQRGIVDAADAGGLRGQAYWLACSLAAGGLLKFRTVGRREYSHLLRLSDALINCTPVHEALGDSIAEALPVSVAVLLSDEAKRVARRRGHAPVSPGPDESPGGAAGGDAAQSPWRALLGGVSNVLESLRAEGVPAPAVRAVAWACLRYIDAELLNALLLRRDCCSVSAAKALQAGLAELRGWVAYVGGECCSSEEADVAIERITQAARFLVQGKDDCMRKAYSGVNIAADLTRSCPALTLQQVYRLSEHQHDDWLGSEGTSGRESMALLQTLKQLMAEQRARLGGSGGSGPGDEEDEDEEDLLVEPREAFKLPWRVLTEAARCFVQPPAAPAGGSTPARVGSLAPAAGTPSTPMLGDSPLRRAALSSAPRLPNGSLPAAAAAASPAVQPAMSTSALLDTIGQACLAADLPTELRGHPEFTFLAADAEA
jgi:myosin-5